MSTDRMKFRAWDKKWKKYRCYDIIAGSFFISTEGDLLIWNYFSLVRAEKKRFVVEQCTGLEDKDGTIIYEGDILEMKRHVFLEEFKVERYAVEYSPMLARWRLGESCIYLNKDTAAECKVVGNVHQNTEDSKQ